jgi:hypothetical protein
LRTKATEFSFSFFLEEIMSSELEKGHERNRSHLEWRTSPFLLWKNTVVIRTQNFQDTKKCYPQHHNFQHRFEFQDLQFDVAVKQVSCNNVKALLFTAILCIPVNIIWFDTKGNFHTFT